MNQLDEHPLLGCISSTASFRAYRYSVFIPVFVPNILEPKDVIGHCMEVSGYRVKGGVIEFQYTNTWDLEWGDLGIAWVRMDQQENTMDLSNNIFRIDVYEEL